MKNSLSSFTYQNPIHGSPSLRDPQIIQVKGTYYMTGTCEPFFAPEGCPHPGVKIYRSEDLQNWTFAAHAIKPAPDTWYQEKFWAPEIFPYKGRFYLTFTSNIPNSSHLGIGLAVADEVAGPYTVLTRDKPLAGGDANLFADDDGKVYLFSWGIEGCEIDLETHSIVPNSNFTVIQKGKAGEWDAAGVEGPQVFKRNGIYYMLYSSWTRGYEVGYATAPTIKGPWIKSPNPIYGAQDESACERNNIPYTQSQEVPFCGVGHGAPFNGPDGQLWISCLGICTQKGASRFNLSCDRVSLVIDPLVIDGNTVKATLTWTPQAKEHPNVRAC